MSMNACLAHEGCVLKGALSAANYNHPFSFKHFKIVVIVRMADKLLRKMGVLIGTIGIVYKSRSHNDSLASYSSSVRQGNEKIVPFFINRRNKGLIDIPYCL